MDKLRLPVVLFCSIALLTFLAYFRSLGGPLIFDDVKYINSSHLKNIAEHLSLSVRSVAKLSYSINYYLSGMNIVAFRATNLILHIFSGGLVFYLTYCTLRLASLRDTYRQLDDARMPLHMALFAATIFLLHPIQTIGGKLYHAKNGNNGRHVFIRGGNLLREGRQPHREKFVGRLCAFGCLLRAGNIFERECGDGHPGAHAV